MKKTIYITIAICVVLLVAGAVLLVLLLTEDDAVKNITLEKHGTTTAEVSFTAQNLHPSQSRGYAVILHGNNEKDLGVTLRFDDAQGKLTEFLMVDVQCNGFSLHAPLAELLGQSHFFRCSFSDTFSISITYGIPDDVGNEAMNAQADFLLHLQIDRQ